jgi:hypothetical protein
MALSDSSFQVVRENAGASRTTKAHCIISIRSSKSSNDMSDKVCICANDCDCVTVKHGDKMNDPKKPDFVSKVNLLSDREFDKAMKVLKTAKAEHTK